MFSAASAVQSRSCERALFYRCVTDKIVDTPLMECRSTELARPVDDADAVVFIRNLDTECYVRSVDIWLPVCNW